VSFYLTQYGVPHELDGKSTQNLPLRDAEAKARKHPIGVEFHCNAAGNPQAGGCETLQAPDDTVLGNKICVALAGSLGIKNRGAKPEGSGHHSKLAFVRAGGIIVELFFLTNQFDLANYEAKRWVAARAVAGVLAEAAR